MRKTLEQERAFYCLKCVERLKLAKDGKWFELKDVKNQFNLKSNNFDDFHKYRFYDGIKLDMFNDFVSWFMNERNNNQLRNILRSLNQDENEAKRKLSEFFKEGKDLNNQNVKNQISQIYPNFPPNFSKYDYASDYSSHAKRLSQMIVSNGLIPTLAFYKSKGDDRGQIYTDICEILEVTGFKPYLDWKNKNNNKEGSLLLEFLLETDFQTLRLATMEVLAIANWLKRIVEVEIE
jgi:CRISPR-associated protein Cmr5